MTDGPAGDGLGDRYDNYYEVLDLAPGDADEAAVDEAYREIVKSAHPDVSDDPDEDLLALAQQARDVLGDPDTRARYDTLGHQQYVRLVEEGQLVIDSDSSGPGSASDRGSPRPSGRGRQSAPGADGAAASRAPADSGAGGSLGVTEREETAGPTTSADMGGYSMDETFDFARAEQADDPLNAPSHVRDVFHQAWLTRVVVIGGGLGFGAGVAYLGGPGGIGVLAPVAGVVDEVGVPTASFLGTIVLAVVVFGVTGVRHVRALYVGAEAPSPPSLLDLKLGSGLVVVALGLTGLGSQQAATHPWVYSRALLVGRPSGSSPWTALLGIRGGIGQVVDYGAAILVVGGLLFGAGLVVAGMAHRAWYARFMAGYPTVPAVWEVVAILPLVGICWGVLFGDATLTVVGSVGGGALVPGGDQLSFAGLTVIAAALLLGGVVGQALRYRQLRSGI